MRARPFTEIRVGGRLKLIINRNRKESPYAFAEEKSKCNQKEITGGNKKK